MSLSLWDDEASKQDYFSKCVDCCVFVVYPTLAESDGEDEAAARQRTKQDKDDAWSPGGK